MSLSAGLLQQNREVCHVHCSYENGPLRKIERSPQETIGYPFVTCFSI
jgi:hypothetical protein